MMGKGQTKKVREAAITKKVTCPKYVPPEIKTYTSEEILEKIGPAQACSVSPCGVP